MHCRYCRYCRHRLMVKSTWGRCLAHPNCPHFLITILPYHYPEPTTVNPVPPRMTTRPNHCIGYSVKLHPSISHLSTGERHGCFIIGLRHLTASCEGLFRVTMSRIKVRGHPHRPSRSCNSRVILTIIGHLPLL